MNPPDRVAVVELKERDALYESTRISLRRRGNDRRVDVEAERADDRTEFCLGAGAHTHYFTDDAVALAVEIDRLIEREPVRLDSARGRGHRDPPTEIASGDESAGCV